MAQMPSQHPVQLALAPDQRPVHTLEPNRAHPALRVRIRARRPRRNLHHVNAHRNQYRVERGAELRIPIPDQVPQPACLFIQFHQ